MWMLVVDLVCWLTSGKSTIAAVAVEMLQKMDPQGANHSSDWERGGRRVRRVIVAVKAIFGAGRLAHGGL
jgi:hypothetical protein